MGGKTCCALPMIFLGVYARMATLAIAGLSIFLHQCSRGSSHSGVSGMGADCPGPQYSATNVDFLNVDISTKDMIDEVENIHCSCD